MRWKGNHEGPPQRAAHLAKQSLAIVGPRVCALDRRAPRRPERTASLRIGGKRHERLGEAPGVAGWHERSAARFRDDPAQRRHVARYDRKPRSHVVEQLVRQRDLDVRCAEEGQEADRRVSVVCLVLLVTLPPEQTNAVLKSQRGDSLGQAPLLGSITHDRERYLGRRLTHERHGVDGLHEAAVGEEVA